jgi:capsular exopolysaccharide synthesis family protein
VELRDYLRLLRKQWRLIVFTLLLAVGAGSLLTQQATPQYQSTVRFYVSQSTTPGEDGSVPLSAADQTVQRSIVSYAQVLSGPLTAQAVAETDPSLSAEDVIDKIVASPVSGTVLLDVSVTDTSPQRTLRIAQALTDAFPRVVSDLERRPDGSTAPITITTIQEPTLPDSPVSPQPVRNLAIALVLGLVLGASIALARELLDNTVKTQEDVRRLAGVSTLGVIGFDPNAGKRPLIVHEDPRSPRAEAVRQLRTNLQFVGVDGDLKSLTVTSSLPKEGKSTLACNLAIALAQAGVRTCLVEGDLRRPRVADYLGVEGAVGLTNVLIGSATLDDVLQPWGGLSLTVLPSGPIPPNPAELLASQHMAEILDELRGRFDMVVIDAPPLLPVTDGAVLARMTDGALMVVRCRSTKHDQLRQAAAALEAVEASVVGAVVNMVPRRGGDAYGYGYGYGYGYRYSPDNKRARLSGQDAEQAAVAARRRSRPAPSAPPGMPSRLPSGDKAPDWAGQSS